MNITTFLDYAIRFRVGRLEVKVSISGTPFAIYSVGLAWDGCAGASGRADATSRTGVTFRASLLDVEVSISRPSFAIVFVLPLLGCWAHHLGPTGPTLPADQRWRRGLLAALNMQSPAC